MGRHILVINRFDNELGCYHRYIDHFADAVAYITTPEGAKPLAHELAETVMTVDDLSNWAEVHARAKQIVARYGPVQHVLALSEYDLDLGASVRERLGVPGPQPDDVRRVRDKATMKRLICAAGLRTPRFRVVKSADTVRRFVNRYGFPVVLKPRSGWDSQGVFLVRSQPFLEELLAAQPLEDYECEEFVDGQMYHVDGIAQDGEIAVLRSSRLFVTCLDFALGMPFGSVANDDEALERRFVTYAERVVDALGMATSAFHLEVFRTKQAVAGPAGPSDHDDLVFLEIGARVGGAQIPNIWREVYGVDLVETWVRMLLGETPDLPFVDVSAEAGGYLLMPEPPVRPCRVLGIAPLMDRVPEMYAELVPAPGTILDGTGGCKETAGRYRFRAPTSRQIEHAIRRVIAEYDLDWEPLGSGGRPPLSPRERVPGRAQAIAYP